MRNKRTEAENFFLDEKFPSRASGSAPAVRNRFPVLTTSNTLLPSPSMRSLSARVRGPRKSERSVDFWGKLGGPGALPGGFQGQRPGEGF